MTLLHSVSHPIRNSNYGPVPTPLSYKYGLNHSFILHFNYRTIAFNDCCGTCWVTSEEQSLKQLPVAEIQMAKISPHTMHILKPIKNHQMMHPERCDIDEYLQDPDKYRSMTPGKTRSSADADKPARHI